MHEISLPATAAARPQMMARIPWAPMSDARVTAPSAVIIYKPERRIIIYSTSPKGRTADVGISPRSLTKSSSSSSSTKVTLGQYPDMASALSEMSMSHL